MTTLTFIPWGFCPPVAQNALLTWWPATTLGKSLWAATIMAAKAGQQRSHWKCQLHPERSNSPPLCCCQALEDRLWEEALAGGTACLLSGCWLWCPARGLPGLKSQPNDTSRRGRTWKASNGAHKNCQPGSARRTTQGILNSPPLEIYLDRVTQAPHLRGCPLALGDGRTCTWPPVSWDPKRIQPPDLRQLWTKSAATERLEIRAPGTKGGGNEHLGYSPC